jgi:hypothetical protein
LGYLDELFRYAMVLTRNQTDAEDLVQETKSDRLRMKHDESAELPGSGSGVRSWNRQQSAIRGRVDEQAGAFLSEVWNERLCRADRAQHVGVDHAEDLFVRKPFKRTRKTIQRC